MTDAVLLIDLPCPATALERAFETVRRERMHDVPVLNPALAVEAVGFRAWREHWLGVLVTPWFMNLVLMPRVAAAWQPIDERESCYHVFPAGVFEFIGGREPTLGDYQSCSLFSPMFEFSDQKEARATALSALEALFDPASREPSPVSPAAAQPLAADPEAAAATPPTVSPAPLLSKRDFLFGTARGERGP